ncbi:MAG: hypothetical protein ABIV63_01900, partial [Caldimonas sp.]
PPAGGATGVRESHALHFDLSRAPLAEPRLFVLRSADHGRALLAHDDASRAKHRAINPTLQNVDDAKLTHYAEDIDLPGSALQAVLVLGKHPTTATPMLASAHIHVPNSARLSVAQRAKNGAAAAGVSAKRTAYGIRARPLAAEQPDNIDDYATPWDVAKYLVFHHPEVMNLNLDLGAEILSRIDALPCAAGDTSCTPLLSSLAFQIAIALQDHGYPSTTPGSWATVVPMTKSDGTPVVDDNGDPVYRYDISDETAKATGEVVKQLLKNIFDDPLFKGTNWHATPTAATQTAGVAGGATASGVRRESPATALRAVAAAAAGTFDVQAATPVGSSLAGIRMVDLKVVDPATRQVQLTIKNDYLRFLSVFVQFRDGNTSTDADGELLPVVKASSLDTDRANWIALAASNSDIMGIPFQGDTVESRPITFTMPAGAASATVMFGSLGLGGDAFTAEAVAGSLLTIGFNIGLPTLLLALGIAADVTIGIEVRSLAYQLGNSTLQEIVISILRGLISTSPRLAGGITDEVGGNSCVGWISSVATSVLQALLDYAPVLATHIVSAGVSAEAVSAACFPLSIACRVLAALASAAEIGVSVGEVLASPAIARNKISLKMDTTVRIARDPRDFQFPAAARSWLLRAYYDGGATPLEASGTITQGTSDPIDAVFPGVPSGGKVRFTVLMYSNDGCLVGYAQSDSIVNMPATAGLVQLPITEMLASLKASTQYQHSLQLGVQGGAHVWQSTSAPTQTRTSLCQGNAGAVCELNGISVHTASGMVGYGYSGGTTLCGGGTGIGHTARNLFLGHDADRALKSLGCGYAQPVGILYDTSGPTVGGRHFFVQPAADGYHLRAVTLDDTTPFPLTSQLSWGRFNNALDSLAVLPSGVVVGVNRQTHKMEALLLGSKPVDQAQEARSVPYATLLSGQGTRSGLLDTPVAVAAFGGAVLVLEQGNARVQALDPNGNPVLLFANGTTNLMPLRAETGIVYLDLAVEGQGYLYVLSYQNNGTDPSEYRLDIYKPNGDFLCRTTGVAAGRLAVDLFRNVYTLNYAPLIGLGSVEPTLSQWLPHTPDECPRTVPSSGASGLMASCGAPATV